jgi:ferritin-like metal-binding protein YciE
MRIDNLQTLFLEQLKDAYDFEHQLVDALGKMEEAASSPQLKRAFAEHRKQTQRQAQRLEKVFAALGEEPERKTCKGMKGLVAEGKEVLDAKGDEAAIDAGLIAAAQKVEHYEMATYGTLRTFAQQLGRNQEARLLQEILDEESQANEKLTGLATSGINRNAEDGESRKAGGLDGLLDSMGLRSGGGSRATGKTSSARSTSRSSNGSSKGRSTGSARGGSAAGRKANGGGSKSDRTKDELMEEARKLDIEGRSQMNKAQLERAVQRRN